MNKIRLFRDVTFSQSRVLEAGEYVVDGSKSLGLASVTSAEAKELLKPRSPMWAAELEAEKPSKPSKPAKETKSSE